MHNTRHFEETPRPANNKVAEQAFLIVILIKMKEKNKNDVF